MEVPKEQDAIIDATTKNSQMTDNDQRANEDKYNLNGTNIKTKKRLARKLAPKTKMNQRQRSAKGKTTQDLSLLVFAWIVRTGGFSQEPRFRGSECPGNLEQALVLDAQHSEPG